MNREVCEHNVEINHYCYDCEKNVAKAIEQTKAIQDVLNAAVDYVNTVNDEYAERDDKDLAHDELCEAVAIYKGDTQ